MPDTGFFTLPIIIVTVLFSYKGFTNHLFFKKYEFEVDKILIYKDYKRLVTSGFLHVNWLHLIFNMLTLYVFSGALVGYLGPLKFLFIYFSSLIGGNLLALLIHKRDSAYSAVGASGAVNGIIFASIALFPGMRIGFFILPIAIPAWLYGLLFIAISIYSIKSRRDNIGHEAHLGGALIGMLIAITMQPSVVLENYLPILAIMVPTLIFMYIIIYKPHYLLVDNLYYKKSHRYSIDQQYNYEKVQEQTDIDKILEKIHKKGIKSLTRKEKEQLENYSRTKR